MADERSVYKPELGEGIIPHEAKLHHERVADALLENALSKCHLNFENIDIIAYSAGPGLSPPLVFTANFATRLSEKYQKTLIPVNHPCAHLEIGRLTTGTKDPIYLYLSGANTQIIAYVEGRFRIFGETQDIATGNLLDVVARKMGLSMPGGSELEKIARGGNYVELPCPIKGMDVSFTGLATAAINLFRSGVPKEDIAYSLQETCFAMLTEVAERAMAHTGNEEILLVGGVAANKRLQEMMGIMAEEREAKMYVVPQKYSGDQGVMIAWTGLLSYRYKKVPKIKDNILPKWRIDQVPWFKA